MSNRTITDTERQELREWFASRVKRWDELTDSMRQNWEWEATDTLENYWGILGTDGVVEINEWFSVSGTPETMNFPYEVS